MNLNRTPSRYNRSGSTLNPSRPWSNFIVIAIKAFRCLYFLFYPKFFFFFYHSDSDYLLSNIYLLFCIFIRVSRDLHTMLKYYLLFGIITSCKYGSSKNFYSLVRSVILVYFGREERNCEDSFGSVPRLKFVLRAVVNSAESISTELYLFLTSYLITRR